jgi:glucose/arabinose dehydrogenase
MRSQYRSPLAAAAIAMVVLDGGVPLNRHDAGVLAQSAAPIAPNFVDAIVIAGLDTPTAVRFSSDGRIFVAEKSGIIKVFDSLSDPSVTIFADLRTSVHNYWDRGLLGLEIDPGFPVNPYVYVLYARDAAIGGTAPRWGTAGATSDGCPDPPGGTTNGCAISGRLSRLQAAGNVMTGSERVLLDGWFQQFPSHSVGSLAFGRDGALYVSGGDGASWQFADYGQAGNPAGDPPVAAGGVQTAPGAQGGALRAQDLRTNGDPAGFNGTVLRINPATGAALPDNPLVAHADANARRIIAYGLRNPFRMTARPGTDEIWIGDVGWRTWEEINRVVDPTAGALNFGWPCYEGSGRQSAYDAANLTVCEDLYAEPGGMTPPFFSYREGTAVVAGEACAVGNSSLSGVAFYEGGAYPAEYKGALFFADYSRQCIWVMFPGANGVPDPARRATFLTGAFPVDLQTGPGGDLFYVDIVGGTIRRVSYHGGANKPPVAVAAAVPASGPVPLSVAFDATPSTDPEGTALRYEWDLDGNGTFAESTSSRPTRIYAAAGLYTVRVRVTDAGGASSVATVRVTAGNSAPRAIIDTPAATLTWRVGQSVAFTGHAIDPEQGTLAPAALTWTWVMQHCAAASSCHEHTIQQFAGTDRGTFVAPDHEYPSHLELRLVARDAGGLIHTASVRLNPQSVVQRIESVPSGLLVAFGSESIRTPATRTVIVNSATSVSAPSPQALAGVSYAFSSWSDGGAATHAVRAAATSTTYTARFAATSISAPLEDIVMYAADVVPRGGWRVVKDATAAGGARLEHPNAGAAKLTTALAAPAHYFELSFTAYAGRPYHLWIRGRAQGDAYANDSVFVQFSGSVTASGAAHHRIGTTSAAAVSLEDCGGCGLLGWGWQDNAYGAVASPVYFAATGRQTLRIQTREDGVSLDQIVLSAKQYLTLSPGKPKSDVVILKRSSSSGEIVLHAAASVAAGAWRRIADTTASGGVRLEHANAGAAKLTTALAAPANYIELTFTAQAGRPYHIWLRGRAQNNAYANDSVFVQFSGSVTAAGAAHYRIGSTSAAAVSIEDCGGCGLSGWGWQDNAYGALGTPIYFAASGRQTIRIQTREDGIALDQIVLSAAAYTKTAPGATRNDAVIMARTQ